MSCWHLEKTQATGIQVFVLYQYLFHGTLCFTASANTDGTLYISEEDKNEKGATADSVQQRRQYRRQNRQTSSGYKTFYTRPVLSHTQPSLFNRLMDVWSCALTPTVVFFPSVHTVKARIKKKLLFMSCLFGFRYRVFLLRRRGAQQANIWARCQKWWGQEETESYTFPTEATQGCLSKVRHFISMI